MSIVGTCPLGVSLAIHSRSVRSGARQPTAGLHLREESVLTHCGRREVAKFSSLWSFEYPGSPLSAAVTLNVIMPEVMHVESPESRRRMCMSTRGSSTAALERRAQSSMQRTERCHHLMYDRWPSMPMGCETDAHQRTRACEWLTRARAGVCMHAPALLGRSPTSTEAYNPTHPLPIRGVRGSD